MIVPPERRAVGLGALFSYPQIRTGFAGCGQ